MKKKLSYTDKKNKSVTNSISNIKQIKFNAQEDIIIEKTEKIRDQEIKYNLRTLAYKNFSNGFV